MHKDDMPHTLLQYVLPYETHTIDRHFRLSPQPLPQLSRFPRHALIESPSVLLGLKLFC
jgi:hypothetical protein